MIVAEPAPRSGFGSGSALFLALVWVLPLVIVAAIVIGAIHLVVAMLATAFGILAISRSRGRIMGIIGIVLTIVATAAAALMGSFFYETLDALSLV